MPLLVIGSHRAAPTPLPYTLLPAEGAAALTCLSLHTPPQGQNDSKSQNLTKYCLKRRSNIP